MGLKVSRKWLGLFFINIILLFIQFVTLIEIWYFNDVVGKWSTYGFWLSLVGLVLQCYTMRKLRIKISDFRIAFIMLANLFMFGRVWLNYLSMDEDIYWVLNKYFSAVSMQKTSVFCCCCIQALFVGLLFFDKKQQTNVVETEADYVTNKGALYATGIVLLIIAIPCRLMADLTSIITTHATGNYNSIASTTGVIDDFANLLIPAVLCLVISKPRLKTGILVSVVLYFLAIMSMTGDRRYYTAGIVALGAFFLSDSRKKKGVKHILRIVCLGFVALFFLNFLEILQQSRLGGLGTVTEFIAEYGLKIFDLSGLFIKVLTEFGISFYSVVAVVENVPTIVPFQYGITLLKTLPSILPIGFLFGDMFDSANPSYAINAYTKLPVGATVFGDLYVNFGLFAVLGCIILGCVINRIIKTHFRIEKGINQVIYFTGYYILINLIRCSIFEAYRGILWGTLIPLFIYNCFLKKTRRRG